MTDLDSAAHELERTIRRLAAEEVARNNIRPHFTSEAPDTWDALVKAGDSMHSTGILPIYDGASDAAIYSPQANGAFRFWHDLGHLSTGLTFTPDDERTLQYAHHLPVIERAGIARNTLPWLMYHADTVGQIDHVVTHGEFPVNQRAFVAAYVIDPTEALAVQF